MLNKTKRIKQIDEKERGTEEVIIVALKSILFKNEDRVLGD